MYSSGSIATLRSSGFGRVRRSSGLKKPDVPPKHLVSYFALVDDRRGKVLLVDHKLAGLWLPKRWSRRAR